MYRASRGNVWPLLRGHDYQLPSSERELENHFTSSGPSDGSGRMMTRNFNMMTSAYDYLCIESVTLCRSSVLWCHHIRVPAIDSSILVCRGPKHEFVAFVGAQVKALDFEINSGLVKGGRDTPLQNNIKCYVKCTSCSGGAVSEHYGVKCGTATISFRTGQD